MAANMGLSPEFVDTDAFRPDKSLDKSASSSLLMEQLRSRVGQHRSWNDSIKAIRMAIGDKRNSTDATHKNILQSCLDKLHRAMKITNQQSLIERLDLISRQIGMILIRPTQLDNQVTLYSEMFKVIVVLEGQSGIKDVMVSHQETYSSCKELVEVLSKGKFEEFVVHLQGLLSIYNIAGDRKQKTKGYLSLTSLETDLNHLSQVQSSINGVTNYIHKSSLGILLPRRGGQSMKLIYFVSPYDLLHRRTKSSYPMTVEAIRDNDLGHSATVCLESSPVQYKLQTVPLMSVKPTQDGKVLPSFQVVNNINSHNLPASFVLVLSQPIPLAKSIIDEIQAITGLDVIHDTEKPFLSVLLNHASHGQAVSESKLLVTLPDQQHVYFLKCQDGFLAQSGALVNKIPFTHPAIVPNILSLLRQQLTFNSVMKSLVRAHSRTDVHTALVFELTVVSISYLSVMFEHPLQESMIMVEFDLSDIACVRCHVCVNSNDATLGSDDFVSRIFQRCFSVPVTLRCIIHQVQEQIKQQILPEPAKKQIVKPRLTWSAKLPIKLFTCIASTPCVASTSSLSTNHHMPSCNTVTSLPRPPPYPVAASDTWLGHPSGHNNPRLEMYEHGAHLNRTVSEPVIVEDYNEQRPHTNTLLATLLDSGLPVLDHPVADVANENPMLSKLLEDSTSVASNSFPAPNPRKRSTKRKPSKDLSASKSPKHRLSDTEVVERTFSDRMVSERHGQGMGEKHIDLDCMNEESVRPSSVSSGSSLVGQSTGSIIDLTEIGESHVKKLENSLDSIMGREPIGSMLGVGHINNHMLGSDMLDVNMHLSDFQHTLNSNQMIGDAGGVVLNPPVQRASRQTLPTPTNRNSPHHGAVPKNEKTSTSLEEFVHGPGGREIDGPNLVHNRHSLQQSRHSLQQSRQNFKRQNSLSKNSLDGRSADVFSPLVSSPTHTLSSPIQLLLPSPNFNASPGILPLSSPTQQSHLTSPVMLNMTMTDLNTKSGIPASQMEANVSRTNSIHVMMNTSLCAEPSLAMLKSHFNVENDVKESQSAGAITQENDFKEEPVNTSTSLQPTFLKLKLSNMKQYERMSPIDSDGSKSRTNTFDFRSDDEDFTLPMVENMAVVSATPTRLQIANKSSLASFNKFNKSEKYKRKQKESEMKTAYSVDSGKRKRDKEDSRKERKKKKVNIYKATTVEVEDGNENDQYKPMPKLKITKKGATLSVENTVHMVKVDSPIVKLVHTPDNEPRIKIEKVEKTNKKPNAEELTLAFKPIKDTKVVKSVDTPPSNLCSTPTNPCTPSTRTPLASDEGIFDRINAMKNENVTTFDLSAPCNFTNKDSPLTKSPALDLSEHFKKSKSEKSHNSQYSGSTKSEKISRTPTIKLKPIVMPTNSVGINITKNTPPTAMTPSTPTSIAQSPTSTTIGKIGAVSLAASGSQKPSMAIDDSNKNPQCSNSTSKILPLKSSSSSSLSKSSGGNLQKNVQNQGMTGKNSPIPPQSGKSGHSNSHSASILNSSSNSLKSDKSSKTVSSAVKKTSSPLYEKERLKSSLSSSRLSSSRDRHRDREKSTSSNKAVTPETTVATHAASVLSFLNPKANKLASLPPIPKLSSNSGNQKVSTPTSNTNSVFVSPPLTSSQNTVLTNVKFSRTNSQSPNTPNISAKGSNSSCVSKNTSASNSSNKNVNLGSSNVSKVSYNKGSNNYSNSANSKPSNATVFGAVNSNNKVGSNSPSIYPQKGNGVPHKGGNLTHANTGFRNYSTAGTVNKSAGTMTSTGSNSNWNYTSSSSHGGKQNSVSVTNKEVFKVNSTPAGSTGNHIVNCDIATSSGDKPVQLLDNDVWNSNIRGSNFSSIAQVGKGPPVSIVNESKSEHTVKEKTGNLVLNNQKVRKGSLSAVIDKLTCKVSGPPDSASLIPTQSSQKVLQEIVEESPASPEMDIPISKFKEDKKFVIPDAPASPEPDSSNNSAVKLGKVSDRLGEIVSIPLEINSESPESPNFVKNKKSNAILNSCPKIIPLNSPNDKLNLQNHVPTSVNKKGVSKQNNQDLVNSSIYVNGEVIEVKNRLGTRDNVMNVQLDLCFHDKVKDAIFKVSTPQSQESSEKNVDGRENFGGCQKSRQNSHSNRISQPDSPVSSPENGLIIDCSTSPQNSQNEANSPHCNFVHDSLSETRTSPNFLNSKKSTSRLKGSPLGSPTGSTTSPGFQDDGLMDEALGLGQ